MTARGLTHPREPPVPNIPCAGQPSRPVRSNLPTDKSYNPRPTRGIQFLRTGLNKTRRSEGGVRIDTVDCLDLCEHGPNVVVYPEGTWYLGPEEADIPEVVEQHLKGAPQ